MAIHKYPERIRLQDVQDFAEVAQFNSFTEACKKLGVSQSAISQKIDTLENALGTKLFVRLARGVELTAAGSVLLEHAQQALVILRRAELEIDRENAERGSATRKPLKIGYSPSHLSLVMQALVAMRRQFPLQPVETTEAQANVVAERVRKHDQDALDIGVAYSPSKRDMQHIGAAIVKETPLDLVMADNHHLMSGAAIALNELKEEPMALLASGTRISATVNGYFRKYNFRPKRVMLRATAVPTVLAAVRLGLAVTVLPRVEFVPDRTLVHRPLTPEPPKQPIALLWNKNETPSPEAQAFMDAVREAAARMK